MKPLKLAVLLSITAVKEKKVMRTMKSFMMVLTFIIIVAPILAESGFTGTTQKFRAQAPTAALPAGEQPTRASVERPIYFLVANNVNYVTGDDLRTNCDNLMRHMRLMETYGVQGEYYLTGLAAIAVAGACPEVIEKLRQEQRLWYSHHGANRPPRPMPIDRVRGSNWEEDVQAIIEYESCAIDPVTGALDCTQVGGLRNMIENIFVGAPLSTGRFMQASILYVTKLFGARMCTGLKDNTGASTEQAWFLGMLNRPDGPLFVNPSRDFLPWALQGRGDLPAELEASMAEVDRTQFNLMTFVMHDTDFFVGRTPAEQARIWQRYEEIIQWAKNRPEIVFVTLEDIQDMAIDDRVRTFSKSDVARAADFINSAVEGCPTSQCLPSYINLGDDYLSYTDAFQAFVFSLAAYGRTGSLPETVTVGDLLGPTEIVHLRTDRQTVGGEAVLTAAQAVAEGLSDRVAARIQLAGVGEVNAAVFLYASAQEFKKIYELGTPGPVLLRDLTPLTAEAWENRQADELTKLQFWTFKPVRWK
ncbi:MAG: hypothetical protein HY232_12470 [Acidobacteria bacterium]|nr:hypothetical protein [Acidobacteriota bacterium]